MVILSTYNIGKEDKLLRQEVLNSAALYLKQTADLMVEISFIGRNAIKEVNKETRNTDKVTDVLSFPSLNDIKGKILDTKEFEADTDIDTNAIMIGEILICKSRAKEQAEEYGHSLKRELAFLALHGFLHLMGFDHIEENDRIEMEETAKNILNGLEIYR